MFRDNKEKETPKIKDKNIIQQEQQRKTILKSIILSRELGAQPNKNYVLRKLRKK